MRVPVGPRQLRDLAGDGVEAGKRLLTLVPRVEGLLDTAEHLLERIARLVVRLEATETATGRVVAVVDSYTPSLERLRPLVERLAATWQPDDVERMKNFGPTMEELLATSRALNEIIGSVPGLGRAKKRADEQLEQEA